MKFTVQFTTKNFLTFSSCNLQPENAEKYLALNCNLLSMKLIFNEGLNT